MSSITNYLRIAAQQVPHRDAVIHESSGLRLSYSELDERTERLAAGLHGLGLSRGDRLACLLPTGVEYIEIYLAAARVGIVIVPINVLLHSEEVRYVLENSAASCLAVHTTMMKTAEDAGALGQMYVIMVGEAANDSSGSRLKTTALDGVREFSGNPYVVEVDDGELLLLGFTSGTTGFPKAAELTHGGVAAVNKTNVLGYRMPMASRGAYVGNMSFTATVPAFILSHFSVAGTVVLASSNEPERVLRTLQDHDCGYTSVAPPLVGAWADAAKKEPSRLTSLVSILQGAGAAHLDDVVRLNEATGGRLLTGWGMTENSGGLVTALSAADSMLALRGNPAVLASVGHPLPGLEVKISSGEDGLEVGDDGVGELLVRGPSISPRYWQRPEASAAAFTGGWYHTGDLGRFDEQGRIVLHDRRTDLIVTGGMNVYPSEVERVLRRMPGITDCAIVGLQHPRWGRAVGAVVVARDDLDAAQVVSWCREHMASFKKPVGVVFREELPRTVAGKVRRGFLEETTNWSLD